MKSGSALKSVPCKLAFDPSALEVVSITEGDFFRLGNGRSAFANHVDAPEGRISVGVSRSGDRARPGGANWRPSLSAREPRGPDRKCACSRSQPFPRRARRRTSWCRRLTRFSIAK